MPRKIPCQVAAITDRGGRVYTVDLTPRMPVPLFRAGQFLHLTVDDYDPSSYWPESRVFSIASSPRDRGSVRICYSVKGSYTTRMEQTLTPGMAVWIKLPYGEFFIDESEDAVLIAGGTGISAFTAFLEALAPAHPHRVMLIHGARSPSLFLFQDMIQKVTNLNLTCFAEADAQPPFLPGRISLDKVWSSVSGLRSPVFYLSGPPAMLKAFAADLANRGTPPDRIRMDAWE